MATGDDSINVEIYKEQAMNEVVQESADIQKCSNLAPNQGLPNVSLTGSDHSVSRTRTACFSQSGCLEDCISTKKTQLPNAINESLPPTQETEKSLAEGGVLTTN